MVTSLAKHCPRSANIANALAAAGPLSPANKTSCDVYKGRVSSGTLAAMHDLGLILDSKSRENCLFGS